MPAASVAPVPGSDAPVRIGILGAALVKPACDNRKKVHEHRAASLEQRDLVATSPSGCPLRAVRP